MSKKLLTVDDSKALRMIVTRYLSPFGIKVIEAENGQQALVEARAAAPDAILLDYNMPIMDGYATLTALKEDPALKSIPVVMLTTETVQSTVVRLIKLGIKDYIAKPFTRETLIQKLNPVLDLYKGSEVPPEASAPPAVVPSTNNAPGKPVILIIDDSEHIQKMLKEFIGEQFQIITADTGQTALPLMAREKFSYIFLDLSLPDMSGADIYKKYLEEASSPIGSRKVIAMTLRTAKNDIEQSIGLGIKNFLYKPFTRDDVRLTLDLLGTEQKDHPQEKAGFLSSSGDVRILTCPAERDPNFKSFTGALSSGVIRAIDQMAEEGLSRLVIRIGEGFLSDSIATRKLIDLVERTGRLTMTVRFVADSPQEQAVLKQFAETAHIPIDSTVDFALASIG
jgi:DNA-binding response OmpR family regulator